MKTFKYILLLTSAALLAGYFFFSSTFTQPVGFFSSPSFYTYYTNLKAFALTQLNHRNDPNAGPLLQSILAFQPTSGEINRAFYQKTLKHLRQLIATEKSVEFTGQYARWIYCNNSMWDTLSQRAPTSTLLSLDCSIECLHNAMERQSKQKGFTQWWKSKTRSSDLSFYGNLPFPLFKTETGTLVIRTPSPIKTASGKPIIAEEFYRYLTEVQQAGELHLYVNLLKMRKEEKPYTELLHALEEDPRVNRGYRVVTLDSCSSFYWQRGAFEPLIDASEFKMVFLERMLSKGEGYRWSLTCDPILWRQALETLLNEVHERYFQGEILLSVEQRQDFIQLTHLEIVYTLLRNHSFNTMNLSCQHTLDRGGSFLALLYYQHAADSNGVISSDSLSHWISLVVELPPLLNNRKPHPHRLHRLVSALRKIYRKEELFLLGTKLCL